MDSAIFQPIPRSCVLCASIWQSRPVSWRQKKLLDTSASPLSSTNQQVLQKFQKFTVAQIFVVSHHFHQIRDGRCEQSFSIIIMIGHLQHLDQHQHQRQQQLQQNGQRLQQQQQQHLRHHRHNLVVSSQPHKTANCYRQDISRCWGPNDSGTSYEMKKIGQWWCLMWYNKVPSTLGALHLFPPKYFYWRRVLGIKYYSLGPFQWNEKWKPIKKLPTAIIFYSVLSLSQIKLTKPTKYLA